jgi:hypothetical protein
MMLQITDYAFFVNEDSELFFPHFGKFSPLLLFPYSEHFKWINQDKFNQNKTKTKKQVSII